MQRESICGVLSHNWDISVTLPPPPPIAQRMWIRDRKTVRAIVQGRQEGKVSSGQEMAILFIYMVRGCICMYTLYSCPYKTSYIHKTFWQGLGKSL